jgi:hypothetical protein
VRDDAGTNKIVSYFKAKTKAAVPGDSTKKINAELAAQVEAIAKLVQDTKIYLITQVEGVNEATAKTYIANPDLIKRKDNYDAINKLVFGNGEGSVIFLLKEELIKFRNKACATTTDPDLAKSINTLLDTSDKQMGINNLSWQEFNFGTTMIISAMAQLSEIEMNVRLVESIVSSKV